MPSGATEAFVAADVHVKPSVKDLEENTDSNTIHASPQIKPRDEQPVEKGNLYEVRLESAENPKNLPTARKWLIICILCLGTLCATCASSMVRGFSSLLAP